MARRLDTKLKEYKYDLKTSANSLPGVAKALAKKWPGGLPKNRVKIKMAGGSVAILEANGGGRLKAAKWGGPEVTWGSGWDLPTWTSELSCGYSEARAGASTAVIKQRCTRKR